MSELVAETPTSPKEVTEVDPAVVAEANALKDAGNQLLANGRFAQAAAKYSEAIALYPNAVYYSNRAQALIKIESYGEAINDANEALKYALQELWRVFRVFMYIIHCF